MSQISVKVKKAAACDPERLRLAGLLAIVPSDGLQTAAAANHRAVPGAPPDASGSARCGRGRRASAACGRGPVDRRPAPAPDRAPSARLDRRPEVALGHPSAQAAQSGVARRVAGGKGGHGLLPHRPAEDQFRRRDRGDVQCLRNALHDPARGDQHQGSGHRHQRTVPAPVGKGAEADPAAGDPPGHRQSRGHRALPGRVLQPRALDQGRGQVHRFGQRARKFRAAGRDGEGEPPARRQRPARRARRRLAMAIRIRSARERHPH